MSQSKQRSAAEALTNTVTGFTIGCLLNWFLLPIYFNTESSPFQALGYTAIFTIVTTLRSYAVRRIFNTGDAP